MLSLMILDNLLNIMSNVADDYFFLLNFALIISHALSKVNYYVFECIFLLIYPVSVQ